MSREINEKIEGISFCNVEVRGVGVIETRTEMSIHAAVRGAVCFAKRHKLSELERGGANRS